MHATIISAKVWLCGELRSAPQFPLLGQFYCSGIAEGPPFVNRAQFHRITPPSFGITATHLTLIPTVTSVLSCLAYLTYILYVWRDRRSTLPLLIVNYRRDCLSCVF